MFHYFWRGRLVKILTLLAIEISSAPAFAAHQGSAHSDPVAPVILGVTGILFFAVLGRFAARKIGQPSVLGELLMGVVLGNLGYYFGSDLIIILRQGPEIFDVVDLMLAGQTVEEAAKASISAGAVEESLDALRGPDGAELLQVAHTVDVFSRYGVIFLLFLVGLDTSVEELREVGRNSIRVALTGMILPFVLGFSVIWVLMPGLSLNSNMFIAATLGATSVGITARVLQDINKQQSREAHIILGAAIMDDILGLLMLAIVTGFVVSGGVELSEMLKVVLLATAFLVGAIYVGPYFLHFVIRYLCRLDIIEAKMFTSYLFVMVLAWMANLVGLATIVGAFTAGLVLREAFFRACRADPNKAYTIKDLIMPLEVILVPIFFVLMGMQVKIESFLDWQVVITAAGLLVAAIVGKLASGIFAGKSVNRLAVGIGMMPRGEVGLIFAAIGKTLGVIEDSLFSAIVLMVIVTTLAVPPLLKATLQNDGDGRASR
ncbi:MAG: cation:proton antiporter [Pseudomonadota bacterium]|nr:cation:proton antiporter [Pseudomonadota bacterium]